MANEDPIKLIEDFKTKLESEQPKGPSKGMEYWLYTLGSALISAAFGLDKAAKLTGEQAWMAAAVGIVVLSAGVLTWWKRKDFDLARARMAFEVDIKKLDLRVAKVAAIKGA